MSDPISNKNETNNEHNVYNRESQIIDYIFFTSGVTIFIRYCSILSFDMITTSNHRGLFLNIDLVITLKDPLYQHTTTTDRLFKINNPKCVHKYKTYPLKQPINIIYARKVLLFKYRLTTTHITIGHDVSEWDWQIYHNMCHQNRTSLEDDPDITFMVSYSSFFNTTYIIIELYQNKTKNKLNQ